MLLDEKDIFKNGMRIINSIYLAAFILCVGIYSVHVVVTFYHYCFKG